MFSFRHTKCFNVKETFATDRVRWMQMICCGDPCKEPEKGEEEADTQNIEFSPA